MRPRSLGPFAFVASQGHSGPIGPSSIMAPPPTRALTRKVTDSGEKSRSGPQSRAFRDCSEAQSELGDFPFHKAGVLVLAAALVHTGPKAPPPILESGKEPPKKAARIKDRSSVGISVEALREELGTLAEMAACGVPLKLRTSGLGSAKQQSGSPMSSRDSWPDGSAQSSPTFSPRITGYVSLNDSDCDS